MRLIIILFVSLVFQLAIGQDAPYYILKNVSINSPSSEITPFVYRKGILFARVPESEEGKKTPYLDLFYAIAKDSVPFEFTKVRPLTGQINELFNEAAVTLQARNKIFFTRNSFYHGRKKVTKEGVLKLDIFEAEMNDNGDWEKIKPFPWNNPEYSVGHPTWSAKEKRLYFASDMPGGKGGTDIYYSKWDGENWAEPRHMKAVNTEKDEMFPSIGGDQSLYFSSDRAGGKGGLDLYVLQRDTQALEWDTVAVALDRVFNSTDDDFGITFLPDGQAGYFTSNRAGGKGSDDIYYFQRIVPKKVVPPNPFIDFAMNVFDEDTKLGLPNAKLTLVNISMNKMETFFADSLGNAMATLDTSFQYRILVEKDGYLKQKVEKIRPTLAGAKIGLYKLEINKSYQVKNIYYDYDKADIRTDAAENLQVIIDMLKENPAVKIELSSHTDARGNEKYNLELSDKRAKSAVTFIVSKGIDANRIVGKGYGASQIINKCKVGVSCTEAEHEQNRRTEFKIIGL